MASAEIFTIHTPKHKKVPVLISVPHSGTDFPAELRALFAAEILAEPEDTDWFVDELYDFAPNLGITLIHARYSRYVIDLNRSPDNQKLYGDGRRETSLTPSHSFSGKILYKDEQAMQAHLSDEEIERRLEKYYLPYHQKIAETLQSFKNHYGHALFFDAHSIRPFVPSLSPQPFPDLILGDLDGKTAAPSLSAAAAAALAAGPFALSRNHPFKGGFLTRHFGKPETRIHALQLEMSQAVYMEDGINKMSPPKLNTIRPLLKNMLNSLIENLRALS